MIPEYYEFQNKTKILSGKNAVEHISFELASRGVARPALLVCPKTRGMGLLNLVTAPFQENGIAACLVFEDIPSFFSPSVCEDIVKLFDENSCDSIIAVGDSPVMETAKGAVALLLQTAPEAPDAEDRIIPVKRRDIPFIAVPSTARGESGAALDLPLTEPDGRSGPDFLACNSQPDVAVLDVRMFVPLSPVIAASLGMDTLSHAVEAYTSLQKSPLSDAYAVSAIELVRDNLLIAAQDPKNGPVRLAMANAAFLSGSSFSNATSGLTCALARACAGICGVPRSNAAAVLLPHCMSYNLEACALDYGKLLPWICGEVVYTSTAPQDRGARVVAEIYNLTDKLSEICNLPLTLSECGVTEDNLELIAKTAMNDRAMLTSPKPAGLDDVMQILRQAM